MGGSRAPSDRLDECCGAAHVLWAALDSGKRSATFRALVRIGDMGAAGRILVRGEPGWQIIPELAPQAGELVIDKSGKSAFHQTDLEVELHKRGVSRLVITGVTSDCCVQSTMRDGFERGFECVLLEDCTAAVETPNHLATLEILKAYGGRWGGVSSLAAFQTMLERADV